MVANKFEAALPMHNPLRGVAHALLLLFLLAATIPFLHQHGGHEALPHQVSCNHSHSGKHLHDMRFAHADCFLCHALLHGKNPVSCLASSVSQSYQVPVAGPGPFDTLLPEREILGISLLRAPPAA